MKSGIFWGTEQPLDDLLSVSKDIAQSINKTNNIDLIIPDEHGDIEIPCHDPIYLQIGGGKSTSGNYFDVILLYGDEEETIQSFSYETYEDFINHVVSQVNDILSKQIKIVTYSQKHRCHGKRWLFLNEHSEWKEYESFEFHGIFTKLFVTKTYTREKLYDFRFV